MKVILPFIIELLICYQLNAFSHHVRPLRNLFTKEKSDFTYNRFSSLKHNTILNTNYKKKFIIIENLNYYFFMLDIV